MLRRSSLFVAVSLLAASAGLAACGSSSAGRAARAAGAAAQPTTTTVDPTRARPYDVVVPKSYDGTKAVPLIVLLHGYGASGMIQNIYFGLEPLAQSRGFLYVHPDGTVNGLGKRFWNATDACCAGRSKVDDSAYIMAIIDDVSAKYKVDPKRVYLIGHSNGGFMSYRMACDHADRIAAIVSMAGATFADPTRCRPSQPVSVLQVHGTADKTIGYTGGAILGHKYPGAADSTGAWANYDHCDHTATVGAPRALDVIANVDGPETTVSTYGHCADGTSVALWSVAGGPHIPILAPGAMAGFVDFLLAHPKH